MALTDSALFLGTFDLDSVTGHFGLTMIRYLEIVWNRYSVHAAECVTHLCVPSPDIVHNKHIEWVEVSVFTDKIW